MIKTITFLFAVLLTTVGFAQVSPIDFEAGGNGAAWTWTVFENDDNPALEVVVNPDASGINTSATVAKFTARQTGQPYAGVESMHGNIGAFDLTAANATVNIMVYKTKISDVGIKFATASGGAQGEIKVPNTLVNQWEMITFDFSGNIGLGETTGLDQIIVFPDFIARPADDIIYFDNITFGPQVVGPTLELPITFEGGQTPAFGDFNGSSTQIVSNPDASGINTSANVSQNTVPGGAAFAGTNFPVTTDIDISTDKMFTMSVRSPVVNTPVLLKLENATTGVNAERVAVLTTTGAWETVTFDFSTEGALTFESVTVFMNFNMVDGAEQVFLWDNLEQIVSNSPSGPNAPIDFEVSGEGANWTWNVFENGDDPALEIVPNPDASGINTSATVAKFTARQTGQPFAGVESMHGSDLGTFDLTADNATVNIMVYKTKISDVGIKFATASGGAQGEIKVPNTLVNQWEMITFDFSGYIGLGETTDLDQIIIFPDFIARPADDFIYFDNITFAPEVVGPTIELPITFEGGQAPAFGDFNGSSTQIVANPDASGVNTTANVAQNTVPGGAAFAGVNFPVTTNIDITTDKMFTMSVRSPLPNTPVLLKLENATTGVNAERVAMTSTANTWETLTFDFTTEGSLTFESVTVFMNFNMVDGAEQVYFWDNLEQVVPVLNQIELPITLEGGQLPIFGDFNGSATQVIANPNAVGENTSATVVENTVPGGAAFAGTNFPLDTDVNITTDKGFTMSVWSPLPNTPVLLKLENATTGVNAERVATTTMTNAWETITFDFSTEGALTFESVTVFMNFNMTDAAAQVYYWDNLEQISLVVMGDPVVLPITFEDLTVDYNPIGFEGADTAVEANTVSGGINTSATVLRTTKTVGAQFFAGTAISLGTPIDFSESEMITMKSYSPKMGIPVKMRLENADNSVGIEFDATTGVLNEWEELTFDFTGMTTGVDFVTVVVFYEFIVDLPGDGSTYYYDDVAVAPAPMGDPVVLPITFEDLTVDYNPVGFEGADSAVEVNAVAGGINTSATVLRTTKTVGAQFFAGTFINLGTPIDFSTSEIITLKSYSPKAGIPVKMRLENADNSVGIEFDANTTVVDEWEVLNFNFTGLTSGTDFVRVVVFYEFIVELPGDGSTYYFDDVEVAPVPMGDPVVLPITFEDVTVDYNPIGFEGADSVVEANAVAGGINTSATVLRTTKTVGAQFFAGTAINLGTPIDFSEFEGISMKTYSPKAGIPVKLRLENADNSVGIEVDVNTTATDEWETLTYDFTGMTAGTDFVRVVVFFEFIVDLPGDGSTYYFDDVMVANPLNVDGLELNAVSVYPNPTNSELNINAQVSIANISVVNMLGQKVLTAQPKTTSVQLQLTQLNAGIYMIHISDDFGNVKTVKIVKK